MCQLWGRVTRHLTLPPQKWQRFDLRHSSTPEWACVRWKTVFTEFYLWRISSVECSTLEYEVLRLRVANAGITIRRSGYIKPEDLSRSRVITMVSRQLKILAHGLYCPLIYTCRPPRDKESQTFRFHILDYPEPCFPTICRINRVFCSIIAKARLFTAWRFSSIAVLQLLFSNPLSSKCILRSS